jgi:flagellar biosynthesis/type III secretory pathway chaperone
MYVVRDMYTQLSDIFKRENELLERALNVELKKRRAILTANGPNLRALSEESEAIARGLSATAQERGLLLDRLADEGISPDQFNSLARITALFDERAPQLSEKISATIERLRELAGKLRSETEENGRLLFSANSTIHRLLNTLKGPEDTYGQVGTIHKKTSGDGILFSTNA